MPEVDKKYIDPATGKIKKFSEYSDIKHDAGPVSLESARPHWFKADGTIRSTADIRAEQARDVEARQLVDAELRARNHREPTADERQIQAFDKLIELRQQETRYANPDARRAAQEYIDELKAKRQTVVDRMAEERRVANLAASPSVINAREHAQASPARPRPVLTRWPSRSLSRLRIAMRWSPASYPAPTSPRSQKSKRQHSNIPGSRPPPLAKPQTRRSGKPHKRGWRKPKPSNDWRMRGRPVNKSFLEAEVARLQHALMQPAWNSTQRRQLNAELLRTRALLAKHDNEQQATANDGKPLG